MLKAYEMQIDDAVTNPNYEFFEKSVELKKAGLARAESYYKEILKTPFDFTKMEEIELDGDKKAFAKDEAQLKEYWRKTLKYDVMTRLATKLEQQEEAREKEIDKMDADGNPKEEKSLMKEKEERKELLSKSKEDLEIEAREKTLERYDDWFERLNQERRSDYMSNLSLIHISEPTRPY